VSEEHKSSASSLLSVLSRTLSLTYSLLNLYPIRTLNLTHSLTHSLTPPHPVPCLQTLSKQLNRKPRSQVRQRLYDHLRHPIVGALLVILWCRTLVHLSVDHFALSLLLSVAYLTHAIAPKYTQRNARGTLDFKDLLYAREKVDERKDRTTLLYYLLRERASASSSSEPASASSSALSTR
jgi:hypothetical protein